MGSCLERLALVALPWETSLTGPLALELEAICARVYRSKIRMVLQFSDQGK